MEEMLKPVSGFPFYLVSNQGYIVNLQTGVVSRGNVNVATGYRDFTFIGKLKKRKYITIHRVVAEAFCEKPEGANEVNHKNGIKTDNRAENLEWVTREGNLRHAFETGLMPNNAAPKSVIATNMKTGETMKFSSIYKAARFFNISQGNICLCCKGVRPHANGYYWEYA